MSNDMDIPTDEASLALITEALDVAYDVDEYGNHTLVGGAFTLDRLLKFWSGYDAAKEQDEGAIVYYPHGVLSQKDVIRALIKEIRELRSLEGDLTKKRA